MYIAGRWVPLGVANAFFLLWLIEALIVVGLFIYFRRRRPPPSDPQPKHPPNARKQKTRRGKKR